MFTFFANRCTKHKAWLAIFIILGCFPTYSLAQTLDAPIFKQFSLGTRGEAIVTGSAPALAKVELYMGSRQLGKTNADVLGNFTIILPEFYQLGVMQFVLRAINGNGMSIASTETANIVIVEQKTKAFIAYVQKADGTQQFISKDPRILRANLKNNIDFDVQYISYKNGALSIIGHGRGQSEAGSQIMLTIGKLRIGREKINENGSFILVRLIDLPSSDQIFRLDYLSATGEIIGSLAIPFHLNIQQRIFSQVYKNGKPIRTVLVGKGDTLSTIAERYYGDMRYIDNLYESNREILADKNQLKIGQEILLPDFSID